MSTEPTANAEPEKKTRPETTRCLFVKRMHREGRDKEWYATVRKLQEETGKGFNEIAGEAMRMMGYQGPDEERAIEAARQQKVARLTKTTGDVLREEIRAERAASNFEEAVAMLPDKAPVQEEMDWIRAHPAMGRKARQPDKTKDIIISVDDILTASHGKAPSKSAVYALQHWCNCPHEFYKQLLGEHKKMSEESAAKNAAAKDVGISEIERLLSEVPGSVLVSVPTSPPKGETE